MFTVSCKLNKTHLSECHRNGVVHRVHRCCHGDQGDSWVGRWGLDSLKSGDTLGLRERMEKGEGNIVRINKCNKRK